MIFILNDQIFSNHYFFVKITRKRFLPRITRIARIRQRANALFVSSRFKWISSEHEERDAQTKIFVSFVLFVAKFLSYFDRAFDEVYILEDFETLLGRDFCHE